MSEGSKSLRMAAAVVLGAGILVASHGACSIATKARERTVVSPPPQVSVIRVAPRTLTRRLTLQAELEPFQEVDVRARVAGYVKSISVDVGSRVDRGQLLAVLSIPELEHEQDQARAAVARRAAEVARVRQELNRAQSAHESIHLQAQRLAAVGDSGSQLVAQQEVDDAISRDKAGEAQIAADQAALAAAQAALADAQANAAKMHSMVEYSRITAPFAGVVAKRYADTGAMLPAGTSTTAQGLPLVRITQNDPLRLVIPVPESGAPFIRVGTLVRVRVPAMNRVFTGAVTRFSGDLSATTRTLHTEVDVPNPRLELTPGEYAVAEIDLERRDNALTVPLGAVLDRDSRPSILVLGPGNRIERRAVALGIEAPDEIEIVQGLRPNELVVVGNPSELKPGDAATPRVTPDPARESR